MKINPIKEYNNQNNKPNFKAKLQISGNTNLLTSSQIDTLKEFGSRIGTKADVIDIALPITKKTSKSIANANIAGWVNGILKQFTQGIEKTDVLGSLIEGLKSNYVVKEVNFDAWKEVFDLNDEKTLKSLNRLYNFAYNRTEGKEFYFNSVEDMLERINAPLSSDGDRVIHHAALRNTDLLKLCLKHPNINVNVQNCLGNTALHLVSWNGKEESIKLLLERDDVDTTIENYFGNTAEQNAHSDGCEFWRKYAKNGYKKFW